MKSTGLAMIADVAAVTVFAAIGRRAHAETSALVGVAQTAWPFLTGTALGWIALRASGRWSPEGVVRPVSGLIVAGSTVAVGMCLRLATGRSVALSFIVVATAVLTTLLVGWRLLWSRRPARSSSPMA